uniref:CSON014451 protein n=1 Tax=Culicoides sonorensis TaxID=179676 RepID=A0A336KSB7_CULSO
MIKEKENDAFLIIIEQILREKTGIRQICAVFILDHNSNDVSLPAVVIKRPREISLTEIEILEIADDCLENDLKLHGGVFFVDEFPVTEQGIHDRRKIEEFANNFHRQQIMEAKISRELNRRKLKPYTYV